jgi:hypothetical protein
MHDAYKIMQMQIYVNENVYKRDYYKNNEKNLFDVMKNLLEFLMIELDFLLDIQNMHENKLNLLKTINILNKKIFN